VVSVATWKLPRSLRSQPPHFSKSQVVAVLEQISTLLMLDGANAFRVRAYTNASRVIQSLEQDLAGLAENGGIFGVKGIGKGIGGLVTEAVMQGTWGGLGELYEKIPDGLIQMLQIPGLGPKRIKQFHDELGIETIDELKVAAEDGQLANLERMGKKSELRVLEGIDLLTRMAGRRRLDVGLLYGEALENRLRNMSGVERASLAGSARRRRETIGDIDIVAAVKESDIEAVSAEILALPGIVGIKGSGTSKVSIILGTEFFENAGTALPSHSPLPDVKDAESESSSGNGKSESVVQTTASSHSIDQDVTSESDALEIPAASDSGIDGGVLAALGGEAWQEMSQTTTIDVQVRMVPPHAFPFTLAYFTGSKEHNVRLRQLALDRGLRLSEWGLSPLDLIGDTTGIEAAAHSLPAIDEADIHAHLGLEWIPPELREDSGEVEAAIANSLPRLVEPSDIKGALHNHTIASDGVATLQQMAEEAMDLGWEFLGIADHSESLNIGGRSIGVAADKVAEQSDLIHELNESWADEGTEFRLLHGAECDILTDGRLDYPDDVRENLNHVVGSVHALGSWRNRDEIENTEMLIKAIEDPTFTILGHPTGRILGGRDGFPVDMHAVLRRMGELNEEGTLKAVEINASPYRLDLDWRFCHFAKQQEVPVVINPDAHAPKGLRDVWFGVQIARKGWLEPADLLNTRSGKELEKMLAGE